MNKTQHRHFAVEVLGAVSGPVYDTMNAAHEAKNAAIRTARAQYNAALDADDVAAIDAAGKTLDALLES